MVTLDPLGLRLVAEVLLDVMLKQNKQVDSVGGLETGGIPIAATVSLMSEIRGKPIPAFFVRQKEKERGTRKWIEGNLEPKSNVVILDDVTTRGNSVLKAVEKVEEIDCKVVEITSLVDREEGAAQNFRNYMFTPIFRMSQFMSSD